MKERTVALIVIGVATVLMQIHSIQFWQAHDLYFGWAFSVALEVCMLWLWYKNQLIVVRVIAALLLIAGPWYTIAEPTITSLEQVLVLDSKIEVLESSISRKAESVRTFNSNSKTKAGWGKHIAKTEISVDSKEARLFKLMDERTELGTVWRLGLISLMQLLTFAVVVITQLKTIEMIRPKDRELKESDITTEDTCHTCQHITDDELSCKTTKLGNLPAFPFTKRMKCYESI